MRVAILCSDGPQHRYLVSVLRNHFEVVGVVLEPGSAQGRRLLRRHRYIDWLLALYQHTMRSVLHLDKYRVKYFAMAGGDGLQATYPVLVVSWINAPEVGEWLQRAAPHVTVVMGTSVLHEGLLRAAGDVVLNIHAGYLPDFRGTHCFFFAFYEQAFDKIGSTIHFVDRGIDTGDILEVVSPPLDPSDTPETLYCRAQKSAIDRLVDWIRLYESGGALPRTPQSRQGRLYRTRDRTPLRDLNYWWRRRIGHLRIPARPN